jgi:hypothetical protein
MIVKPSLGAGIGEADFRLKAPFLTLKPQIAQRYHP